MGTARVKQEEEADKNNSKRGERNLEERNMDTILGKSPKQGLPSAKVLTIILNEEVL